MPNPPLRLAPLGGVGEFGMNCTLLQCAETRVLIDCGVLFPGPEHPGVDLIVPSFDRLDSPVRALVLTHAHEDHIGAVPYLLRQLAGMQGGLPLTIIGTRFTLALVRRRLEEHDRVGDVDFVEAVPGDSLPLGDVDVELIHVNHSIPGAVSLAFHTPQGVVCLTGDWRIDTQPVGEAPTDLARFGQLGQAGVRLLLGDSTNAGRSGYTLSESEVGTAIVDVMDIAPAAVVVTLFSSNVWRLRSILYAAYETGRRVALLGRSVINNLQAARDLDILSLPSAGVLIDQREIRATPRDELVVVAGGSQGEPHSSMTRIAMGDHPHFEIEKGDWVLYSSRQIPGNARRIASVVDALHRSGAEVHYDGDFKLHTSGHAHAEEIKILMSLVRPQTFVPVHGNYRQLTKLKDIASACGLESCMIRSGEVLEVDGDHAGVVAEEPHAKQYVTVGGGLGTIDDTTLRDRRRLAFSGVVTCHLVVDDTQRLRCAPRVQMVGVAIAKLLPDLEDGIEETVREILRGPWRSEPSEETLAEQVRIGLRRFFRGRLRRRPIVLTTVECLAREE